MVLYKHRELIRNKKLMSHVSALEVKIPKHRENSYSFEKKFI